MKSSEILPLGLLLAAAAVVNGAEIANSITDFTAAGVQGENGWTYGYRDYAADGGGENYDAVDAFIAFDEATMWRPNWRIVPANAPWTFIGAEQGHPNGENNGGEHWAIRRWTTDVAEDTPLALTWSVRAQNLNGTGTSGSLHLDGVQVDTQAVAGNDDVGVTRTVYVNVEPGSNIDLALTPVGPSGDRGDGADGSFFSMSIDDAVNDVETQPDGSLFIAEGAEDDDTDDLPDAWELLYAADLNVLSGLDGADSDSDFLTDLDELRQNTNPTTTDTDSDGLTDFDEFDEHGTSPRIADTDGDGFEDGAEISGGSDPLDPLSRPVIADSVAEFSGIQGQDGWSHGYRNHSADGGGDNYQVGDFVAFAGGADNPDAFNGTTQQWRGVWDLVDPQGGAGPWTFLGPEATHPNGTNSAPNEEHWTVRRWTATELAEITPVALVWLARKGNANNDGVTGSLHINGIMVDSRVVPGNDQAGEERTYYANLAPTDVVDVALSPVGVNNRTDGSDSSVTWLLVSTAIPSNPVQPGGTPFIPASAEDSDADNLPDPWEEIYSPGDLTLLSGLGDADNDNDGSPDLEEFNRSTDPTDADTDDDDLTDGVESGDGTFDGPTDTGTDPRVADTDGDGRDDGDEVNGVGGDATDPTNADSDGDSLSDGAEIADHGTDPNEPDTDGDGTDDGVEVNRMFDPLDPTNNPDSLLADSFEDFTTTGNQGDANWNYGYRNLTADGGVIESYDPVADFVPFDEATEWRPNWRLAPNGAPWTFIAAEGNHPNGINSAPNEEHWTIRRWTANELATVTPLGLTWHTRKTNLNGNGVTGALFVNGVLADTLAFAGNDGVGAVRTWFANVNPGDVVDLALTPIGLDGGTADGSDGSANWLRIDTSIPPDPTQPDGTPFIPLASGSLQITSVTFDPASGELTITWPSAAGRTYALDTTTTLRADGGAGDWLEFDDGIEGEPGETSTTVTVDQPLPPEFFVRIRDVTE